LYIRWAQFALLCSHARFHGDSAREPWLFGSDADRIVREFAELRYRLIPYLYSAAHEAHLTGLPVIRAMPLAFPVDRNTYDKDLQFMLGDSLLIAPIYDISDHRSVYIPDGRWLDYWTGVEQVGGRNIEVTCPLEQMPIYVKAGAIIPTMADALRVPNGLISPLVVEVYPNGNGEYMLYEDEGETRFSYRENGQDFRFEWKGSIEREMIVHFHFAGRSQVTGQKDVRVLDDGTLEVRIAQAKQGAIDSHYETR
jgi:alpha-D-xyloside xylohydrolase